MDQEHNDNLDETEKIVRWTMRGIDAAGQKQSEHDPMGDDKVRYIKPPLINPDHTREESNTKLVPKCVFSFPIMARQILPISLILFFNFSKQ